MACHAIRHDPALSPPYFVDSIHGMAAPDVGGGETTVKILGYTYRVEVVDSDAMDAMGRFQSRRQRLQIADDLAGDELLSTLLHEVIEALNYHLALDLPHNAIMQLEAGLYQVLADNGVNLAPLLENHETS